MSNKKIANIVEKINEKTTAGLLEWESTETEGTYQVSFVNYSVRILSKYNPQYADENDYIIQVMNSNGELVEEVYDEEFKGFLDKAYDKMKNIHELARRQVMGVDKALESILDELK